MGATAWLCIGVVLVLLMIGMQIWKSRNAATSENNKRISIAVGALQATHVLLYSTGLLAQISQANVPVAFGISAALSVLCFLLSLWVLLPCSNFQHGTKYLFLFFSILQVLITVFIFLLPEAGIPAPIQF